MEAANPSYWLTADGVSIVPLDKLDVGGQSSARLAKIPFAHAIRAECVAEGDAVGASG